MPSPHLESYSIKLIVECSTVFNLGFVSNHEHHGLTIRRQYVSDNGETDF